MLVYGYVRAEASKVKTKTTKERCDQKANGGQSSPCGGHIWDTSGTHLGEWNGF